MAATLFIDIEPKEAADVATIVVDGNKLAGTKLELPAAKRVHVSVTAVGFRRYSKDVDVDGDTVVKVALVALPHKRSSRTLAVTAAMGALGVIAWLIRRR